LKLVRIDSRARTSKIALSTQEELSSWIKFGPGQNGEEDF